MAKYNKVHIRDTPKYSSSSDEESSDDEIDYSDLLKGLARSKVDKINELIDALNEKDRLLEKQEDILYEEHDKFVSVQKSLAIAIKKNELLSSELSTYHESISSLKNLNDDLNAKLEKVNETSSCVEHVVICNRCKDLDVDTCNKYASTIIKLNNEVASLNAQLKTCKDNYEKLKFARDAYTVGRPPQLRMDLVFERKPRT
jgi:chromosome segregation ATPase